MNCDCVINAADLACNWFVCDPQLCFLNWDCNGDGVLDFADLDCLQPILTDPNHYGPCGRCRGDANCDGVRDFDDINPFVAVLSGAVPCSFQSLDVNGDGVINFDDIGPFVSNLGQPCTTPIGSLWLGPFSTCAQCCKVDCNDPNYSVTHAEVELCGQDLNGGCDSHVDPNDPNSPVDPNAWEDLGVLSASYPTGICGTLWADNGHRDTDWYQFRFPIASTLTWELESDLPVLSTPVFGEGSLSPPTSAANCGPGAPLWGYWSTPRSFGPPLCAPAGNSPTDLFPGCSAPYWWVVLPDDGQSLYNGYPCSLGFNNYRLTITIMPVLCSPCLQTDRSENEPACGPGYVDTFNSGCDNTDGTFHSQPQIDPNFYYCGKSGVWTDPNGNGRADYDWWKIVLTGTVKKRLRFDINSAFDTQWELYSVPGDNCANKVRLDYYECGACASNVSVFTPCLDPNNAVYYVRFVPNTCGDVGCDDSSMNRYRFQYSIVTEAPACTSCTVACTTNIDDPCQTDPNSPDTNAGCTAADPNNPAHYMTFSAGNNTFGPVYCGRLSTFSGSDGNPAADLDWFRYTQLPGRTKLVVRGKAMFRMSINIGSSCTDPNSVTHGWDRPCKGTTTPATQIWTGLTPGVTYTGVVFYGNGGGDGTGEQPLKQFVLGLPCTDNRNTYQVELQCQT
jgi:hypothetical protein